MAFVKSILKTRMIIIEEGNLASCLLKVCTAQGEELIITDPKTNGWIGQADQNNDTIDVSKLAQPAKVDTSKRSIIKLITGEDSAGKRD